MGVFNHDGIWRFQTAISWTDAAGVKRKARPSGTPDINTKQAALDLEREEIEKLKHPERFIKAPEPTTASRGRFPTLRKFAERFLAEYAPLAANTARVSRKNITNNVIVPFFGALELDQIHQGVVNAFIGTMKGQAASSINNALTVLSTLLKYAADVVPGFVKPSLTLRVKLKGSAKAATKIRAITRTEVAALIKAMRSDQRFVVVALLATDAGLRIGEIRGLMWSDITTKGEGSITIKRSIDQFNVEGPPKGGSARTVPGLTTALREALAALPKRGMWVITPLPREHDPRLGTRYLGYKGMLTKIKRGYKAIGIKIVKDGDVHAFHSLRHTFGTELAARNVPVTVIMELMGHADIETTERYITTSADQMRAAMRTLSDL